MPALYTLLVLLLCCEHAIRLMMFSVIIAPIISWIGPSIWTLVYHLMHRISLVRGFIPRGRRRQHQLMCICSSQLWLMLLMCLEGRCLHACGVTHCIFHPGALPSCMINRLGRVWSVKLTRLIQHGLKRVLRPFLPLLLLFWRPLSLSLIPWCPLLRTIFLPLTVSVTRLILYYRCHLIGGVSVIRSFLSLLPLNSLRLDDPAASLAY